MLCVCSCCDRSCLWMLSCFCCFVVVAFGLFACLLFGVLVGFVVFVVKWRFEFELI